MLDRGRHRILGHAGGRLRGTLAPMVAMLAVVACGPDLEPPGSHAAATVTSSRAKALEKKPASPPAAGLYQVSGVTTQLSDGTVRAISGRWILTESAPIFRSTFDLRTDVATRDGVLHAERVGSASAIRGDDGELVGVAESRLLFSAFAGLPPRYPFGPGRVGPLVTATFRMNTLEGGAFSIELVTAPLPGDDWPAERTLLRAQPVGAHWRQ